jgi:hypothetical protein
VNSRIFEETNIKGKICPDFLPNSGLKYFLGKMYALFCILFANWQSPANLTGFSVLFPQL